jgi:hypothetical protein
MKAFDLPGVSRRPLAIRGPFHQPRTRVVFNNANPFRSLWRDYMAALARAVRS